MNYLNNEVAYFLYKSEVVRNYFVDKSMMLETLFPMVEQAKNSICITRPRRFGKTVMANMIGAFFGRGTDSHNLFGRLSIADSDDYKRHLNQHNVIYISFNEMPKRCKSYERYISRIENRLLEDLEKSYPQCGITKDDALWDAFSKVAASVSGEQFIFILDEWDFIFHRNFVTDEDKEDYISFLSNLLKDKAYVSLAYMTGILPIAKYSSGSELNMFIEYTMAKSPMFSDYFGFTETEVDELYSRYLKFCKDPAVSREGLRIWYDGYCTASGERVYNPRSVVAALSGNHMDNYWTSSGPYDEIFYYIQNNIADVRDDLALMISGEAVPAKVQEYAATSMNLQTKDEIFSAMVVYGFLSYEDGYVRIPNKELMDKFADMLQKESSLGYVYRLAKESERMLYATLTGDTETMAEILAYAHNLETPILSYNNEVELSAIINLVYLSARNRYQVEREDKAGMGFVDFIFYPKNVNDDGIILELKIDHSPEEAIKQIKDKSYDLRFQGKLGELPHYTGRILAVGIGYDKTTKKYQCKVEAL